MAMTSGTATKVLPMPPVEAHAGKDVRSSPPRRNDNITSTKVPENQDINNQDDDEFEFFQSFDREKVKDVIHSITADLKDRGADVEYLMIPFRPQQTNEKLLRLLNALFPMGNGQPVAEKQMLKIIQKTEPLTLFQGLTYLWCRLPDSQVIGWKAYLEFKVREKEKKYPSRAFLELMPQCLSSPSHASIVYDFFDLIISLASNSRVNKMSARKISKMCAVWAFGKPLEETGNSLDYDFTNTSELPNNSFQDGLNEWIPATDAMFHLLLAFLKSFVPEDLENAQLPLTLKSLLFNNEYPPKGSTAYSSQTVLTIPLVTLRTDRFSRKPWELLERCGALLDFSKHDAFQAREDYALLKSLFKKSNQVEGVSRKMSQESRRLIKVMSTKHSTFQAGWSKRKCLLNEAKLPESIEVNRVEIDDFFIWAWLSTLSYEQTSTKRNLFGRSLILEFEFDGFKKWVLFQECDITVESRKRQMQRDTEPPVPATIEIAKKQTAPKEQRNISPVYENFQNRVSSAGSHSSGSTTSEIYHTVISKDSLGKNGSKHNVKLHAIEQKISKWNPLSKSKRKTSSNGTISSKEDRALPDIPGNKKDSILSDHHKSIYELPPIERDVEGFKDIFVGHGLDDDEDAELDEDFSYKFEQSKPGAVMTQTKNPSDEAMEELQGMMDQMITEDIMDFPVDDSVSTGNSTRETFESLTKFDQYKPTQGYVDTPTSSSSAVPSLRLNGSVPSLQPVESQELQHTPVLLERQLPEIRIEKSSQATSPTSYQSDVALQEKILPGIPGHGEPRAGASQSPARSVPRSQSPPRAWVVSQSPPRGGATPQSPPRRMPRSQSPPRPVPRSQSPLRAGGLSQSPPRGGAIPPSSPSRMPRSQSPPRAAVISQSPPRSVPRTQSPQSIAPPVQAPGMTYQRSDSPARVAPQDHKIVSRSQAPAHRDNNYEPSSQAPAQAGYAYGRSSQVPAGYAYGPSSQAPAQPDHNYESSPQVPAQTGYAYGPSSQVPAGYAYGPSSQAPAKGGYAYGPSSQAPAQPDHNYEPSPQVPAQTGYAYGPSSQVPAKGGYAYGPGSQSPPRVPPAQADTAHQRPDSPARVPGQTPAYGPRYAPPQASGAYHRSDSPAGVAPPQGGMAYGPPPHAAYGPPRAAGPLEHPAAGYGGSRSPRQRADQPWAAPCPGAPAPAPGPAAYAPHPHHRWNGDYAPPPGAHVRAQPRSHSPMRTPHAVPPPTVKLHGGHANRQQDRKKLHNNIRNGDFGI